MNKVLVSKVSLWFLLIFNGAIIATAFIVPHFYFLNPAVIGKYCGLSTVLWGVVSILATSLGFGLYEKSTN